MSLPWGYHCFKRVFTFYFFIFKNNFVFALSRNKSCFSVGTFYFVKMQEDFIHFLWKFKKFDVLNVKTVDNKTLQIFNVGEHNVNSGPDFFNAKIKIGEQLWAGNVEIHLKSSDWFTHHHETDKAYDNVILHVVWNHDAEIFRKNKSVVPTLELKNFVPNQLLKNYHQLFSAKQRWIPCENNFAEVDDFILDNWKERLYIERLERKSQQINILQEVENRRLLKMSIKELLLPGTYTNPAIYGYELVGVSTHKSLLKILT